jgi:catechol 2,3-dioxygenase-like lactoylglutathione lyase family enzyme
MPIKVLELHHHGIRIGKSAEDVTKAREFYTDVLGLEADAGRPNSPGIPGFWLYVGNDQNTATSSVSLQESTPCTKEAAFAAQ